MEPKWNQNGTVMHRIEFLDIFPFDFYHRTHKRLTVCIMMVRGKQKIGNFLKIIKLQMMDKHLPTAKEKMKRKTKKHIYKASK